MSAKSLAPQVADPTPQINIHLEAICIALGIPVRIFKGSERGELASSQDDASWNDRIRHRQLFHVTPRILVPFIDRLIQMGVLPEPGDSSKFKEGNSSKPLNPLRNRLYLVKNADGTTSIKRGGIHLNIEDKERADEEAPDTETNGKVEGEDDPLGEKSEKNPDEKKVGYSIEWPTLDSQTDTDKANIANLFTTALAAYVSGDCQSVMPPEHYFTEVWKMEEEKVTQMLEDAAKAEEEQMAEDAALAEQQGTIPTPPGGFQHPVPPPMMPPSKGGGKVPPPVVGGGKTPPQQPPKPPVGGGGAKPASQQPPPK